MLKISFKGKYLSGSLRDPEELTLRKIETLCKKYGAAGVSALSEHTPKDSGKTGEKWAYGVSRRGDRIRISWSNDNVNDGVIIAIIIQYGHGTGTGGYVEGVDYINPALCPVFEKLKRDMIREVNAVEFHR